MSSDPRIRQLKIKTGVVKRLWKEKNMYEKEAIDQERKVKKMESDGKDEYDIKKQKEVLSESQSIIPDCKRRLTTAINELKAMLENENDLSETKEYQEASTVLLETEQ